MLLGGLELLLLKGLFVGAVTAGVVLAVITVSAILNAIDEWWGDEVYVLPEGMVDEIPHRQTKNEVKDVMREMGGKHKIVNINATTGEIKAIGGDSIASDLQGDNVFKVTW